MLFVALLISANVVSANPLARAEKGQLQCYRPDVARKTCQSIAAYQRTGPGTYDNKAVIPLGNGATLETRTPVTLKDGAVCGFIRAEDLMAGTIRVHDQILPAEQAKPILQQIAQAQAPLADKEICTEYEPLGADFTTKVTIAGADQPDQRITVKWIEPSDGYTVTP